MKNQKKWGFTGFLREKGGFRVGKGGYFDGFALIDGGFWVKCGKRGVGCLELQRGQVVKGKKRIQRKIGSILQEGTYRGDQKIEVNAEMKLHDIK